MLALDRWFRVLTVLTLVTLCAAPMVVTLLTEITLITPCLAALVLTVLALLTESRRSR